MRNEPVADFLDLESLAALGHGADGGVDAIHRVLRVPLVGLLLQQAVLARLYEAHRLVHVMDFNLRTEHSLYNFVSEYNS